MKTKKKHPIRNFFLILLLVLVVGVHDWGFHIDGSREVAGVAQKIYEKAGAADQFRYIEGPEGHRYYADLSWPVIHEFLD